VDLLGDVEIEGAVLGAVGVGFGGGPAGDGEGDGNDASAGLQLFF